MRMASSRRPVKCIQIVSASFFPSAARSIATSTTLLRLASDHFAQPRPRSTWIELLLQRGHLRLRGGISLQPPRVGRQQREHCGAIYCCWRARFDYFCLHSALQGDIWMEPDICTEPDIGTGLDYKTGSSRHYERDRFILPCQGQARGVEFWLCRGQRAPEIRCNCNALPLLRARLLLRRGLSHQVSTWLGPETMPSWRAPSTSAT
jgi:hypothetical protein